MSAVATRQRCTAHTSAGEPCRRQAITGGVVCPTHGGSAPQVVEAAQARLDALVDQAIDSIGSMSRMAESEAVRLSASREILDRSTHGPKKVATGKASSGVTVVVGVGFQRQRDQDAPVVEAQVVESGEDLQ